MNAKVYVISDLHLGHEGILKFARPEFSCVDDMHEKLIDSWNSVVKKRDITIVLGDVVWSREYLPLLKRLRGSKRLVMGNHDKFSIKEYSDYFISLHGALSYKQCFLTHIPIHPTELYRKRYNIHGHLHTYNVDDPRYINANVDMYPTYEPIEFGELIKQHELKVSYGDKSET